MENGIVKRVIGPVVDVQFPAGKLPEINNAIEVHTGERRIVMEAVQQLGDLQHGAVGVYEPFARWAGAGASVPLTGFGNLLAGGVRKAVAERGVLGAFTGGFTAGAAGICAAIFFGLLAAMLFRSKDKQ